LVWKTAVAPASLPALSVHCALFEKGVTKASQNETAPKRNRAGAASLFV
jgi:hypothetical protein